MSLVFSASGKTLRLKYIHLTEVGSCREGPRPLVGYLPLFPVGSGGFLLGTLLAGSGVTPVGTVHTITLQIVHVALCIFPERSRSC